MRILDSSQRRPREGLDEGERKALRPRRMSDRCPEGSCYYVEELLARSRAQRVSVASLRACCWGMARSGRCLICNLQ